MLLIMYVRRIITPSTSLISSVNFLVCEQQEGCSSPQQKQPLERQTVGDLLAFFPTANVLNIEQRINGVLDSTFNTK